MSDEAKKPDRDDTEYWKFGDREEKDKESKDAHVSPIFDKLKGERMRLVRMRQLWEQAELAEMLGLSQKQVSKIEQGKLNHVDITMEKFKTVFGNWHKYILYGTYMGSISPGEIHKRFWETRLRLRRKNKTQFGRYEGKNRYK